MNLIERVEELPAKLSPEALMDRELPHQRDVGVKEGRSINEVPPCVAIASERHLGQRNKGGGVEEFLNKCVAVGMSDPDVIVCSAGN